MKLGDLYQWTPRKRGEPREKDGRFIAETRDNLCLLSKYDAYIRRGYDEIRIPREAKKQEPVKIRTWKQWFLNLFMKRETK